MKHLLTTLCIITLCVLIHCSPAAPAGQDLSFQATPQTELDILQCGIASLYCCLKKHSISTSFDDMHKTIKTDENYETNLFQLAQYAKKKGLWYKGHTKVSPRIIKNTLNDHTNIIIQYNIETPNYTYGHFACLIKTNDGEIQMLDYPNKYLLTDESLSELCQRSSGLIALSSKHIVTPVVVAKYIVISVLLLIILYLSFKSRHKHK